MLGSGETPLVKQVSSTAATPEEQGSEAYIEAGRLLFAQPCSFLGSAAEIDQLPQGGLPEVAFAGRSNVGKSSLVNALTGRKTLARTSQTPGRTRLLNFFDLGGRLILVDLPGYGYARASKQEIEAWTSLTRDYLRGRAQLRRLCLLVDARHGLKETDHATMATLDEAAVSYQLVLTKADKARAAALEEVRGEILQEARQHPASHPQQPVTSALDKQGIAALRAELAALAAAPGAV